jgi:NAD(P)-dependent dehydrogenase (short-subunit alcohol dehydrogenase family)
MSVALITGGSRGLGLALARDLAERHWQLVIDGRDGQALAAAAAQLAIHTSVTAIPGDVADAEHRLALVAAVAERGRLDLLVNNASLLGPSPQPELAEYPLEVLRLVFDVNALAPLALIQLALPHLQASGGCIVNVTSDAAFEAYPGWGGYGSSKAALEQLTKILMEECPDLRIYLADPGDLRTQMHQEAFPGEDISDRPLPEVTLPGFRALIEGNLANGRYRLQQFEEWPLPAALAALPDLEDEWAQVSPLTPAPPFGATVA